MDFNFNSLTNASFTSDVQNYLKPYNIYKVKVSKLEKSELKGKDNETVYPIVKVEFLGEDGIFSENIFIPSKEDDFKRRENENTHKFMPSRFEQFQYTLMQIVEAVNPTGAETIKKNASKLRTMDDFIGLVLKGIKNNVDVYLKLVGQNVNGKVYARLPNSCLINNDGNVSPLNFINSDKEKLFFSNYEIGQMKKYQDAKPTEMPEQVDSSDESLDLDGIEL